MGGAAGSIQGPQPSPKQNTLTIFKTGRPMFQDMVMMNVESRRRAVLEILLAPVPQVLYPTMKKILWSVRQALWS